jgi:ABC-type nitrate/sulfonate/bicarbonate transport system ATPase subunit
MNQAKKVRELGWFSCGAASAATKRKHYSTAAKLAERRERARAVLALVGLDEFADAYPHQLSGGMRSRVALARSLVGEPDLLLMDEPFSRLDALTRGTMHRELLRIHELRGMSILFITHDVEEAVMLADSIVLLSARPGRVREKIAVPLPQPRIGIGEAVDLIAPTSPSRRR